MDQWSHHKGAEGIRNYQAQHNLSGVEGLEGLGAG